MSELTREEVIAIMEECFGATWVYGPPRLVQMSPETIGFRRGHTLTGHAERIIAFARRIEMEVVARGAAKR